MAVGNPCVPCGAAISRLWSGLCRSTADGVRSGGHREPVEKIGSRAARSWGLWLLCWLCRWVDSARRSVFGEADSALGASDPEAQALPLGHSVHQGDGGRRCFNEKAVEFQYHVVAPDPDFTPEAIRCDIHDANPLDTIAGQVVHGLNPGIAVEAGRLSGLFDRVFGIGCLFGGWVVFVAERPG